jgi:hypothetical protein
MVPPHPRPSMLSPSRHGVRVARFLTTRREGWPHRSSGLRPVATSRGRWPRPNRTHHRVDAQVAEDGARQAGCGGGPPEADRVDDSPHPPGALRGGQTPGHTGPFEDGSRRSGPGRRPRVGTAGAARGGWHSALGPHHRAQVADEGGQSPLTFLFRRARRTIDAGCTVARTGVSSGPSTTWPRRRLTRKAGPRSDFAV